MAGVVHSPALSNQLFSLILLLKVFVNLLSSVGNSCNVEFLIRSTFARFLADEALLCVAHLIIPESESEDIEGLNGCYLQS